MTATPGAGRRRALPIISRGRSRLAAVLAGVILTSLPVPTIAADGQLATEKLQKAVVKCQGVIAKASAKALTAKLKALDACGNAALACVQTKHEKAKCFPKAGQACAKKLNEAATLAATAKARAQIVAAKSCARDVPFLDLLSADGLGLELLTAPCFVDFGLNICGGIDPLAECLVRTHERAAGTLYDAARPRMSELLARLPDVSLPAVDGLPLVADCTPTAECPEASPDAKAVEQCGTAITKATQGLVAGLEKPFGTCAQKVLACVQTKPDAPECLAKAKVGCDQGAEKIGAAFTKFGALLAKQCGEVNFGALTIPSGLNLAAIACAGVPSDATALTACLQERAEQTVAELVQQSVARVGEFGERGQLGKLCAHLAPSCPSGTSTSATRARRGLFGSITKIIRSIRRPRVNLLGGTRPGGRPNPAPGVGPGVTIVGRPPPIRFGGLTKIPFRYTLGRARSTVAQRSEPPMLIVTVRREGVTLEDHFEIALDPAQGEDELEVAYQDTLPGCALTLELAIRDGGIVGDYTPVLQVVDAALTRFVDNGDGTVTDTQTGLQWEKKTTAVGSGPNFADPHDVDNSYTWCLDANADFNCDNTQSTTGPKDGPLFTQFLAALNTPPCFAGHCDWRVPTVNEDGGAPELETIIDQNAPGCGSSGPCIAQIFGPTVGDRYWSATTFATGPIIAWDVYFFGGFVDYDNKGNGHYVRAVRAGS